MESVLLGDCLELVACKFNLQATSSRQFAFDNITLRDNHNIKSMNVLGGGVTQGGFRPWYNLHGTESMGKLCTSQLPVLGSLELRKDTGGNKLASVSIKGSHRQRIITAYYHINHSMWTLTSPAGEFQHLFLRRRVQMSKNI